MQRRGRTRRYSDGGFRTPFAPCTTATSASSSWGQFVSRVGFWMQNMALAWLVYRLTESSLMLGLVAFAGQAPTLVFGLFAGVVADRFDRYRVILVTLVLALTQALLLGVLTILDRITAWQVFGLALAAGSIQAFEMPARQSFLMEIVGRDDITSAVALNSTLVNAARILGPALAGRARGAVRRGRLLRRERTVLRAHHRRLSGHAAAGPRPVELRCGAPPARSSARASAMRCTRRPFACCWCWSDSSACSARRTRC